MCLCVCSDSTTGLGSIHNSNNKRQPTVATVATATTTATTTSTTKTTTVMKMMVMKGLLLLCILSLGQQGCRCEEQSEAMGGVRIGATTMTKSGLGLMNDQESVERIQQLHTLQTNWQNDDNVETGLVGQDDDQSSMQRLLKKGKNKSKGKSKSNSKSKSKSKGKKKGKRKSKSCNSSSSSSDEDCDDGNNRFRSFPTVSPAPSRSFSPSRTPSLSYLPTVSQEPTSSQGPSSIPTISQVPTVSSPPSRVPTVSAQPSPVRAPRPGIRAQATGPRTRAGTRAGTRSFDQSGENADFVVLEVLDGDKADLTADEKELLEKAKTDADPDTPGIQPVRSSRTSRRRHQDS